MHLKRWLTGLVALPILVFLLGPGPRWLFDLFLCAACLRGVMEFYAMTAPDLPKPIRWCSYALIFLFFLTIYLRQILFGPVIIICFAIIPMTFYPLARPSPAPKITGEIGKAVLGPVYVGLPLSLLLHIDTYYPKGNLWVFFLLVVVFTGDTAAFYSGKLFGKHKLHQRISPGKTWEGAIGGLLGGTLAGLLVLNALGLREPGAGVLGLTVALSISGQLGDLAESMLKRNHDVKDSGRILPGHGGILDRIDGLLFSAPILFGNLLLTAM